MEITYKQDDSLGTQLPNIEPPFKLNSIEDLLNIAWFYKGDAVDRDKLWSLIPELTELSQMVGLKRVKEQILDMMLFYIQNMNKLPNEEHGMAHTVLYGIPGSGKTSCANILAKIFAKIGIVSKGHIIKAKRTDFIEKYIGGSDLKTQELLDSAKGGILFIDEVYNLASGDKTDVFAKAFVGYLNQFLSEEKDDFVCIIAGYKEEVERDFFGANPGLKRRFPWELHFEPYTYQELQNIFLQKIETSGWSFDGSINLGAFQTNYDYFVSQGGDVENFLQMTKRTHVRRMFGMGTQNLRKINQEDIDKSMEQFIASKKRKNEDGPPMSMFL